jgi:hypothetical protein
MDQLAFTCGQISGLLDRKQLIEYLESKGFDFEKQYKLRIALRELANVFYID